MHRKTKCQRLQQGKPSANPDFVHAVCEKNVLLTIKEMRKKSGILKEMQAKKEITYCGRYLQHEYGGSSVFIILLFISI
jgi:carbonic anhydrase